ncbi:MAG: outer membrane lipoprotein-sorting protein [Thermodesulfobacteriota bacterium]
MNLTTQSKRARAASFFMMTRAFFLCCLCLLPTSLPAADDAREIIKKVEERLNGKTAVLKISMIITTSRATRTMKMDSYSVGNEKSFIKITYPGKDYGITFLKIDDAMWQYVPRIEKIIKIPASMMLQSWMGTDFTNDDLVRESSISRDYEARITTENVDSYEIELLPRPEAAVVWGRLVMEVAQKELLPKSVRYFDEEGLLVRTLQYTEVKQLGDRLYPSRWVMIPHDPEKAGNRTIIEITEAAFDVPIAEEYFSKRALQRFSD